MIQIFFFFICIRVCIGISFWGVMKIVLGSVEVDGVLKQRTTNNFESKQTEGYSNDYGVTSTSDLVPSACHSTVE